MENHTNNNIFVKNRAELRAWFEKNYAQPSGIWVVFYKKSSGRPTILYEEIVEEALCFGWIDSVGGKVDEERTKLYVAPRKKKSNWSAINKERVERLAKSGLIAPSGQVVIDEAKESGQWDALNDVDIVPPDLQQALDKNPTAKGYFELFPKSTKRGILEWILNAKQMETREKRIRETVSKAEHNIRANQYRQPKSGGTA